MRPSFALFLALALSLSDGAVAQTGQGDRGEFGVDNDSGRDSNEGLRPPGKRVTGQGVPETVIIVPPPGRSTTRRTPPKPPRRVPRLPPGKSVLDTPLDLTHSIRTPLVRGDIRLLPDGGFEFIAIGPLDQSSAAVIALTDAGAIFLRQRNYPNMDRRALVFDIGDLDLAQVRDLLATAAPDTRADAHSIYRFAAGEPRLYAAAMVNPPETAQCALPAGIRIGQIDGAVQGDHAALRDSGITEHSVLADTTALPRMDHGTAVAALLVGQDASGALAGFAPGARLYAASAFAAEGAGGASDIERIGAALDWLVGQQVQLVNLSFAGPVNVALEEVLNTAAAQGVLLVAAAGNLGNNTAVHPAAAGPVIGVTAIDAAQRRYRAANTGEHVEFAAPGVDVYVATQDGGGYASGTSYAAPILTGLAARLVAEGVRDPDEMRARLRAQSVDLGVAGRDSAFGWGLPKATGC